MYFGQGQDFKLTTELSEKVQYSRNQFYSVLESLKAAENEANERMRNQEEKRERVETNLCKIQKSLKGFLKAGLSHSSVQSSRPNYTLEPQIQIQIN